MQGKLAETEKKARTETILKDVHAKMKGMGCTNDYIRETTLQGIELADNDTADSIATRYKSVYDENFKKAFGDGYVPPKGDSSGGRGELDFSAMVAGLKASGAIPTK
jgi:hypothetical protein